MAIAYGWTQEEESILTENYEALGPMGCLSLLPGRSSKGISKRASKLGLTFDRYGVAKTEQLHVELSRMVRHWRGPVERTALRWAS